VRDEGYQQADQSGKVQPNLPDQETARRGSRPQQTEEARGSREARNSSAALSGPGAALIGMLAAAGRWLLIPLIVILILAGLWALARLWPRLAGWRAKMAGRWRALLDRLAALLDRFRRPKSTARAAADPLANLESLALLPPREAVLATYLRFLDFLETLGSPRPVKATPYEILHGLPVHLRHLEDLARTLTELYVQAAYAPEPVEHDAGQRAILTLKGMRGLQEKSAA